MSTLDLFNYPHRPGVKSADDTSAAAAASVDAATLRHAVVRSIERSGPGTADQIATRLRESPFSIRPRLSELRALGRVVDTGLRAKNASGRPAIVWGLG